MKTKLLKFKNSLFGFCIALSSLTQLHAQTVNFEWAKQIGSTSTDQSMSIATDASGNVYTIGCFNGIVDFDPGAGTFNLTSAGFNDIFISKLDSSGNFVWAKEMGGSATSDCGFSIAADALGNVYTTGSFNGTVDLDPGAGVFNLTSVSWDIFISKLDSSGNFVWAKQAGGSGLDEGYAITSDASAGIYILGRFSGTGSFDTITISSGLANAIFISKLDSSGNFLWAKATGGNWAVYYTYDHSIAVDANHVYITGEFNGIVDFDPGAGTVYLTSSGGADIYVAKYDTSGSFLWAKGLGGALADQGYTVAFDVSGNIYTMGSFSGTVDFDPGAGTFNLTSAGQRDIFISKFDSSGNLTWAKKIGGTGFDEGFSIVTDASGNLFATGFFQSTVDFDPGPGTFTVTATGGDDIFVLELDSSGNFGWAKKLGGTSSEYGNSIAAGPSGSVYTTGPFAGIVDFDPGAGVFNLTSNGDFDIFIHKMSQIPVGIGENMLKNNIKIYPNPSSETFTIQLTQDNWQPASNQKPGVNIEICNVLGEKIYSSIINHQSSIINLDAPSGIYFLHLKTENDSVTQKLIIQK